MALLHQLGLGSQDSPNSIHAVGLMSCTSGEGVTSIAAPLAAAAARHLQLRTILVDCNLNRPGVHRIFGVEVNPGLRSALSNPAGLNEFIRPTAVENLSILTAGEIKAAALQDCGSPNLSHVFSELRGTFDLTIVDAPSFGNGASSGIGSLLDGVVLGCRGRKNSNGCRAKHGIVFEGCRGQSARRRDEQTPRACSSLVVQACVSGDL